MRRPFGIVRFDSLMLLTFLDTIPRRLRAPVFRLSLVSHRSPLPYCCIVRADAARPSALDIEYVCMPLRLRKLLWSINVRKPQRRSSPLSCCYLAPPPFSFKPGGKYSGRPFIPLTYKQHIANPGMI